MNKPKFYIEVGTFLEDTDGIYQITGFKEKGGTLCTVRECVYNDEDDLDKFELGRELYLSKSEVKECIHHMTGRNMEPVIAKKYIATIETNDRESFKVYYDPESNTLVSDTEEEIYDMHLEETSDKGLVEKVYGLYNAPGFEIIDCIEYED